MSSIHLSHTPAGLILLDCHTAKVVYVPYSVLAWKQAMPFFAEVEAINVYVLYPVFAEKV